LTARRCERETPAEWSPSQVFSTTFDGGRLGLIGFSNDDLPDLTSPSNLTPFHVTNSTAAVNAEAARLRAMGVQTIVALGHHLDAGRSQRGVELQDR
jgi:2',3'-cyclic-nucleotide 2'-phosphodiesterase (5'-nucleotidase family)